ncbi:MAG: hypothetical protein K2K82_00315 [Muribaculaceae bacterium]|nr:hypothetical protein [Muribaculaceae bacterium]
MKISLKVLLINAMMALSIAATPANPEKQMVSHSVGDDMVIFVKPRKMPTANKTSSSKPITYDVTLSTQTDSVSVTYTLITKAPTLSADSTGVNGLRSFANERIYVEPKSKEWVYRLRFKMPAETFRETFCSTDSMELKTGNCTFLLPPKKQTKEAEINRMALKIIELNKK